MKKILCVLLSICMVIGLTACGENSNSDDTNVGVNDNTQEIYFYNLGETVSTDILDFTLEQATMCIAVSNGVSGGFEKVYLPKEYDVSADANNPCVAAKGHTLVSIQFEVNNLDRVMYALGSYDNFITVEYNGNEYSSSKSDIGFYKSIDGFDWDNAWGAMGGGFCIEPAENIYVRTYIDVPFEPEKLTDDFNIVFKLPNVVTDADNFECGEFSSYGYTVTEESQQEQAEKEISFEEAVAGFNYDEGKEYFINHMSDYADATNAEIMAVLNNENVSMILPGFEYDVKFSSNSFEYSYKGNTNSIGYTVNDNVITFYAFPFKDKNSESAVKKIDDSTLLLVADDAPYGMIYIK